MTYSEGKRPSPRPLVTVRTDDRPHLGERAKVYRSLGGKPQAAEFVGYERCGEGPEAGEDAGAGDDGAGAVVLRIVDKMGRGKEPEAGSVPEKGDLLCFTLFEHEQRGGAKLPDPEETPWTHGGPPGDPDAVPRPDPVTEEDVL
jgi:hypothetical protein